VIDHRGWGIDAALCPEMCLHRFLPSSATRAQRWNGSD
jgi:hypothetical protein